MFTRIRSAVVAMLVLAIAFAAGPALAADGKVQILWLGQSATRITTPTGKVIVIDPWLTKNPLTPAEYIKALGQTSTVVHDMKPGETIEF